MPSTLSLTHQNYSRGQDEAECSFCPSLVHPTDGGGGGGGVSAGFGLCARKCLARALDLMSPSVRPWHVWHEKESFGVVSAQVKEELGPDV
jgi:hypothetical protein